MKKILPIIIVMCLASVVIVSGDLDLSYDNQELPRVDFTKGISSSVATTGNYTDVIVFTAERASPANGEAFAFGNGRYTLGSAIGYDNSRVVKIGLECVTIATSITVGVRDNGAVTDCNVTAVLTGEPYLNTCNITLDTPDILGIYTEKEVGVSADCVATVWVERDKQVIGLKGDKGDKGDAGSPTDYIYPDLTCGIDDGAGNIIVNVQMRYGNGSIVPQNTGFNYYQLTGNMTGNANGNCACGTDGGDGELIFTSGGFAYYGFFQSDITGDGDVSCLDLNNEDVWFHAVNPFDGEVFSCKMDFDGLPP